LGSDKLHEAESFLRSW